MDIFDLAVIGGGPAGYSAAITACCSISFAFASA